MAVATPESGIAGPGNSTGAILPITTDSAGNPTSGNTAGSAAFTTVTPAQAAGNGSVLPIGGATPAAPGGQSVNQTSGASTTTTTPSGGPTDSYGNPLNEEDAYTQELSQAQSEISGITSYYNNLINQDTVENTKDTDATRAMNLSSGVAGGGAAAANQQTTTTNNNNRTAATVAQMSAALESVYSTISSNAMTLANNAATNAQDAIVNQQKVQASAVTAAQTIGATGINASMYQTQDPTGWQALLTQTGYTPLQLSTVINKALPAQYQPSSQTIPMPSSDGKGTTITVVTSQINPATGQVQQTQSSYDLAIPYANFDAKSLITASDGTPIYINQQGQAINAETGAPYVPTTAIPNTSTLTNTQTGAPVTGPTNASTNTSWVPSGFTTGTSTSELANNNPGGIQAPGGAVPAWASAIDPAATVGTNGQVQFSTPALGLQAMQTALSSSDYSNLTLTAALGKWTGNTGYGANATTVSNLLKQFGLDPAAKVGDVMNDPSESGTLLNAIMQGEGSIAPTTPGTGSDNTLWNAVTSSDPSLANQLTKSGVTPESLNTQAQLWILNGGSVSSSGSSMGGGGIAVKQAINSAGSTLANQLFGPNSAEVIKELATRESGLSGSIDSLISYQGNVQQLEGTAQSLLGDVQAAAGNVDLTDSAAVNEWAQAIQQGTYGSGALTAFQNYISAFSSEYGKVITGSMGSAAATDAAVENAQSRLTSAMNSNQIGAALTAMNTEMQQRMQNINSTITDQQNSMMTIIQQTADTSQGGSQSENTGSGSDQTGTTPSGITYTISE